MKLVLAAVVLVAAFLLLLLSVPADNSAEYDLQNNSSRTLLTWPSWTDCAKPSGPPHHFDTAVAKSTIHAGLVFQSIQEPKCVVAATSEYQVVFLASYRSGSTYVVSDPLSPGETLSERGDVLGPTHPRLYTESVIALLAVVGLGTSLGIFFVVLWAWRGANPRRP